MVVFIRVSGLMDKKMDLENNIGQMDPFMRESGKQISYQEREE